MVLVYYQVEQKTREAWGVTVTLELIEGEIVKDLIEKIDMKGKNLRTANLKDWSDIQNMIGIERGRGTETEGLIGIEITTEERGEKEDEIGHQVRGAIDLDHPTAGIVIGIAHQTGELFELDCLL